MERYSASLVTKEIQIKPTKRCHFTPTKTGNEKDNTVTNVDNLLLSLCGKPGIFTHRWWKCKIVHFGISSKS